MAKPDITKIRKYHPERFGVLGSLKDNNDSLEATKEALEGLIKEAKAELKDIEEKIEAQESEQEDVDVESTDTDGYDANTVAKLKDIAKEREIDLGGAITKAGIIEVLRKEDAK